ncbi:hypothetical protein PRLR5107_31840 [Prevotella lacticifex]|uniref:Uncharacterized protein n=1 Tax=Prevotella lacticifex TaxID=2854755 RepID=A0A9R1CD17_9BACT|nr:hypothetical protein PRLR5003_31860 [Prevotella lacticifex]GJG41214.1 hypothetical protein PRLR5019_31850 [Prevotella lacticifex]GJG44405.1 hypothetical protein PRLR5025_31910 [Prevotella lacticifex]GJG47587.1 hypothetical protein PRLR5027_31820 [Prevotella lacticifex]GJG50778.1 hypothetical protein PRLR5052_31910 [Prevotella lacticifex]
MLFILSQRRKERKDSFGMILLAILAAWRERFPQVVIILSQRREER